MKSLTTQIAQLAEFDRKRVIKDAQEIAMKIHPDDPVLKSPEILYEVAYNTAARVEHERLKPLILALGECVSALEWTTRRLATYECTPTDDSYPVIDAKAALQQLSEVLAGMR